MKRIITGLFRFVIVAICIISGGLTVSAKVVYGSEGSENAVRAINDIIRFNLKNDDASDVDTWISGKLPSKIGGTSEWYAIALSQYWVCDSALSVKAGGALVEYRTSLEKYLSENNEKSASARLKYALALAATGSEKGGYGDTYIRKCMSDGTVGGLGIMSLIFGLHLVNNGYIYSEGGNVTDIYAVDAPDLRKTSAETLTNAILDEQHKDGGWSVIGDNGDVDVTAMVIQALAPFVSVESGESRIAGSIEKGLEFLSQKQLDTGAYKGFGIENAESTAQVLTCLSALGIDCEKDHRFIKNSNTVLDGLFSFANGDGSFSHEKNGEYNATATVQSFYSLVAYVRMKNGLGPLYIFDSCAGIRAKEADGDEKVQDNDGISGENGRVREGTGETHEETGRNGEDKKEENRNEGDNPRGDERGNTEGNEEVSEGVNREENGETATGDELDGPDRNDDVSGINQGEAEEYNTGNNGRGDSSTDSNGAKESGSGNNGANESGAGNNGAGEGGAGNNGEVESYKAGNLENGTENNEKAENSIGSIDGGESATGQIKSENDNNAGNNSSGGSNHEIDKTGISYKVYAIIAIIVAALIACGVFAIRKRHPKNYLFTAIVAVAGILLVVFTDFRSAESYYSEVPAGKENAAGKVTMSIRCDILNGISDSEYIPADGCILDTAEFDINDGDTVYDILIEGAKKYGICVDHKGGSEIVYILGINYLYELDYGDLSGWVYKVNGELPSVGCAGYKLKDGDRIEWCYTLDLGNDSLSSKTIF